MILAEPGTKPCGGFGIAKVEAGQGPIRSLIMHCAEDQVSATLAIGKATNALAHRARMRTGALRLPQEGLIACIRQERLHVVASKRLPEHAEEIVHVTRVSPSSAELGATAPSRVAAIVRVADSIGFRKAQRLVREPFEEGGVAEGSKPHAWW